jgi:putative ABC transport system permease protein
MHQRLQSVQGVESVAGISLPPVDSPIVPAITVIIDGRTRPRNDAERSWSSARYFLITNGLFATLRTPVIRGRELDERDTPAAPWVAIVNETMAKRFWPGEDPIGKQFRLDVLPEEQMREVVGVVRDIPMRLNEVNGEPIVSTQLWTVTPTDPSTFVGVSLLLVVVALGACVIPVLRALRVDPILTLHTE